MFMQVDKLLIELPMPKKQDPNAASALQELLGYIRRNVDAWELSVPEFQFSLQDQVKAFLQFGCQQSPPRSLDTSNWSAMA